MMIVLPYWHAARQFPVKTSGLILLSVLVFILAWPLEKRRTYVVTPDEWRETVRQLTDLALRPESGLPEPERLLLTQEQAGSPEPSPALVSALQKIHAQSHHLSSETKYRWDLTYPVFESLERSIRARPTGTTPYRIFGFRPDRRWLPGLLTHLFFHAGFLHLFFNMLFLWVIGCVLEERLGSRLVGLFLASGAAAALAQMRWGLPPGQIMVGASGAVSGLMGFALLAVPRARIRLFYLVFATFHPRFGTFPAPLWFFVPLWAFEQILMALLTQNSEWNSVGYGAHLGGLAFGAAAALAARLMPRSSAPEPGWETPQRL
jgi:membrane associated rhomboid family serine protease